MNKQQHNPPRWIHFLLRKRIDERALEEIEGDLHEMYQRWISKSGKLIAGLRYLIQVLFYLRKLPRSLRRKPQPVYPKTYSKPLIDTAMFHSSLKIAWRQLRRSKGYAFINIGGLAVGMAVVLMIGLWVWDELSFDRSHKNHDRLAQAWQVVNFDGNNGYYNSMPIPLGEELRTKYPGIEAASVTSYPRDYVIMQDKKKLTLNGLFAESDLPSMLTLEMKEGDVYALTDKHAVLISASMAKTLFGNEAPMEQSFRINDKLDVKVAGVYKDFPGNSSFNGIKFIGNWSLYTQMESYAAYALDKWDENSFQLFVLMKKAVSVDQLSEQIRDIRMKRENPPRYKPQFFLHPMNKWHLYGDFTGWAKSEGLIRLVRLFAIAGIFVLLLACINFMNLSTARSEKRAREVGIRKALGSQKGQLLYQFFSESVLIAFLSLIVCLLLSWLALPFFGSIAGKDIRMPWTNWMFWMALFLFTLFTGLLAGSYPAIFLSSFRPVAVLKGVFKTGRANVLSRKILVVFQFSVSVALIIATIVVGKQIQYAKDRSSGYSRDQLVEVPMYTRELYGHYDVLREDLLKTGVVYNMAQSQGSITADYGGTTDISWPGKAPGSSPLLMANRITHDFGGTVGWKLVKGRDFSRGFSTDTSAIIFNEEAIRVMGLQDPVDKIVRYSGKDYRIIGVAANIIKEDPFKPVKPTLYTLDYRSVNSVMIRIRQGANMQNALARIEQVFNKHSPSSPFDYKFVDEAYAVKFATELRIGKLAGFFAVFAIFISLLGLFGLAAFMAERRTKEIGIRKVLGANVLQVWTLLSKEFILLAALAFIIAAPVAYYFMNQWLENYSYRIQISLWTFVVVALCIVAVTVFTVSIQAIRAALMNPVRSIRTD